MAEENQSPEAGANDGQGGNNEPVFEIQRLYLKDASFESPSSPEVFTKAYQPTSNVELNTVHRKLQENIYEVELNLTLTVKIEDMVAYLVEIKYAGIFGAAGYTDEQMDHLLASFCPNLMFPFAREIISDLAVKGGFPQMLLAPINFDALYMQTLEERRKAAAAAEEEQVKH
ncbi:MAG TPA: protein-export chaperone SecB [Gammaproteobacteria bacterium]|nr:protein-export chaperone SecB [Gammaproteobacteria bacterium]